MIESIAESITEIDSLIESGNLEGAEALLFATLDELTDDAYVDCDNEDYHSAVEKYRLIISLMQRYYGDSIDLNKIEQSIVEIQKLI